MRGGMRGWDEEERCETTVRENVMPRKTVKYYISTRPMVNMREAGIQYLRAHVSFPTLSLPSPHPAPPVESAI